MLSPTLFSNIKPHLPPLLREATPCLIYSTELNGISLSTMFDLSNNRGPCILCIKDSNCNLFGAFLNHDLYRRKGYYGNGTCFLFKLSPTFSIFKATGLNQYFILSEHGADLAIGGGSTGFGLWLDDSLFSGYSCRCETFDNEVLCGGDGKFECDVLELWAFVI